MSDEGEPDAQVTTTPGGIDRIEEVNVYGKAAIGGDYHDHSVTYEAPAPAPTTAPPPIPSISGVVGREGELAELAALFGHASAATIVSKPRGGVYGVRGIGKSTLAAMYCHKYRDKYANICWRDLRIDNEITGLAQALAALIGAEFDPRGMTLDNQAAQIVNWLRGLPDAYLLVLDNCESVLDADGKPAAGWAVLLAQDDLGKSHLLVTSRQHPLAGRGWAKPLDLEGLEQDEAVKLLRTEGLQDADEAQLRDAVQKVGGHPQALIFLAQLVTYYGQALTDLLAKDSLWLGDQGEIATRLLDELYKGLSPAQQSLLQYISLFDRPTPLLFRQLVSPADVAGTIANLNADLRPEGNWSAADIAPLALALSRRSLLNVEAGRYSEHAIVRDYAYRKLADPTAHHRAAAAYFRSHYTRDAHTNPPHSVADVQPLLDAFDQLCAASEWVAAHTLMHGEAFAYTQGDRPMTLNELLAIWGEASRIVRLLGLLAGPSAADRLQPASLGAVLGNLGIAYKNLGEVRKAIDYYEWALKVAERIGDLREQSGVLSDLGNAYLSLGEVRKAIEYYERALKIAEQIGDLQSQGIILGNLGNAYQQLGEVRKAIDYHERALRIVEQIGDRHGQSNHLGNLGLAYAALGEVGKAIDYCERALQIAELIGDLQSQGIILSNLGLAYAALGEVRKAIGYFERGLQIAEQIGDVRGQGNHLVNLGNAYQQLGELDMAADYYARAITICQQIGDQSGEGNDWNNLGVLYGKQGRYLDALTCCLRALVIRIGIEDPDVRSTVSNIRLLRQLVGAADWPALVEQAATLAADRVELPDELLAQVRDIVPEDAPPAADADVDLDELLDELQHLMEDAPPAAETDQPAD